uniref:Taste receptor type 1 member 3-like n=1 Tax=Erpetoichthys calabaricus TaxID=27687 RepID=A0A8C4RMJ9_ERPCA
MVMNWYVYQTVLALLWHMGNPQETLFDNNEQFRLPGDYIIGGLFSLHSRAINLDSRTKPEFITCDSFYPSGYRYFLTMIFAIDEINQATDLLPGVQLGYEVYDSCMEMLGTVPPSLRFVSKGNSNGVAVQCDYMDYQPHVIAVVGPTTSEETIPIARLLGHFHIPQLVEELWRVNFTLETSPISFNSKGDPPSIYEIVNWQWHQDGAPSIVTVGKYSNGKLSIDLPNVYWNTPDNRPPGSNCSSQCEDGQVKRGSGCCSKCDDCPAGTFSNVSDDSNICSPCPLEQWSYPRSSNCRDRIVEMRSWTDFSTIFLLFFSILAMAVLLSVALVFLCQHQSHMVHEAGGASCFLMLLSIFSSCTSLPFFLGPPSPSTCLVRQPFFSSGFTVCIAAMLAWPLRPPHSSTLCCQVSLQSCTGRILVFTISLLPQVVNFFLWLWLTPPAVIPNYDILDNLVLLECFEGSNIFFGFSICYNCILAALALALTVGRLDLWSYNTGRQATFSLSVFIISWIFFLPTYATSKGLNVPCIQVFSGLVCIYSIQGSYFLPKCRLLLFKPHIGTNGFLPRASLDQPDSIRTVDSQ